MSKPSLRQVQLWLKSRISPNPGTFPEVDEEQMLNFQGGDPGIERLSVYNTGYLIRAESGIRESFEAVCHLLGGKQTRALVEDYLRCFPSLDYNLSRIGRYLPEFLKTHSLCASFPFLPDLALLEWKVTDAFHSRQEEPLDFFGLSQLRPEDWENLCFDFQPWMRLVASKWPILDLWNARHIPVTDIDISLQNRPQKVLILRKGFDVSCLLMDAAPFRLLKYLSEAKSLGQALGEVGPGTEGSLKVQEWFSQWTGLGLFSGYSSH